MFTCVFRDWSFTTRKKERQSCALGQHASHWLRTVQQHTPKGGSGCSSLAQPKGAYSQKSRLITVEKKQMASFPFVTCQKVLVKVNFLSSVLILGVCPSTHSPSLCCFLPADKLSITNLKSKRLQNPNLWALTCYHRQKSYTPNLAWYTTAKRSMLKITRDYCTVCIWSERECYANLGVVTKK